MTTVTVDGFETTTINSGTDSSTTVVKNVIDTIAGTAADKTLVITGDKKLTAVLYGPISLSPTLLVLI